MPVYSFRSLAHVRDANLVQKNWINQRNSRTKTISFSTTNSANSITCVLMYQMITNKHHKTQVGFILCNFYVPPVMYFVSVTMKPMEFRTSFKKKCMLYTEENFCFKSTAFWAIPFSVRGKKNLWLAELYQLTLERTFTVPSLYHSECLPEEPAMTVWLLNEQLGTQVRNFQGLSWLIIW